MSGDLIINVHFSFMLRNLESISVVWKIIRVSASSCSQDSSCNSFVDLVLTPLETFPRVYPIQISFGKPLDVKSLLEAGYRLKAEDDYQAITAGIKDAMLKLEHCSQN